MYNMMVVSCEYSAVIDAVTANKILKLHKFELSDKQWRIVDDLIHVLKVWFITPVD